MSKELFLYVMEYFGRNKSIAGYPDQEVIQAAIYAASGTDAVRLMNEIYAGNGKRYNT